MPTTRIVCEWLNILAKHICYVTSNPHNKLVRQHIRVGGRAVALEEGINGQMISIYDNGSHMPLLWTHLIPFTLEGQALHNVENAMFAAAMAYSMGVSLENILVKDFVPLIRRFSKHQVG